MATYDKYITKATATFPPDPLNTELVGKWMRIKEFQGIIGAVQSGNMYFIFGANPNNHNDVQIIDDLGCMRNLHLQRFEEISPLSLTYAEEMILHLHHIKKEVGL